jgi:hypothetical protein
VTDSGLNLPDPQLDQAMKPCLVHGVEATRDRWFGWPFKHHGLPRPDDESAGGDHDIVPKDGEPEN